MLPVDWTTLLATAPNIVTAVAFGYFVLKLLERQDKQNDKRDGEWRTYLSLGRDQYLGSVASITAEVKSLAAVIVETHNAIKQHDDWSKSESVRVDAVRAATAAAVAAEAVRVAADVAARASQRQQEQKQ